MSFFFVKNVFVSEVRAPGSPVSGLKFPVEVADVELLGAMFSSTVALSLDIGLEIGVPVDEVIVRHSRDALCRQRPIAMVLTHRSPQMPQLIEEL